MWGGEGGVSRKRGVRLGVRVVLLCDGVCLVDVRNHEDRKLDFLRNLKVWILR